jgi:hypothetical protein
MSERDPAEYTREGYWMCDCKGGDLCFVHEPFRDRKPLTAHPCWMLPVTATTSSPSETSGG